MALFSLALRFIFVYIYIYIYICILMNTNICVRFSDTVDGTPFAVNLTMGELYLCISVWFDNFHERGAFLPFDDGEIEDGRGYRKVCMCMYVSM
jgi:hypothetical protein